MLPSLEQHRFIFHLPRGNTFCSYVDRDVVVAAVVVIAVVLPYRNRFGVSTRIRASRSHALIGFLLRGCSCCCHGCGVPYDRNSFEATVNIGHLITRVRGGIRDFIPIVYFIVLRAKP
jgi:hypothetical protein